MWRSVMMVTMTNKQNIQLESQNVRFTFLKTGDIYSITSDSILINQVLTNELDGSMNNIYLRIHTDNGIKAYPLLGIKSNSEIKYAAQQIIFTGTVESVKYKVIFTLTDRDVWYWDVFLEGNHEKIDVIYGQDLGLADKGAVQSNEAYTSQYIDYKVFEDEEKGFIVCSRQNMAQSTGNPYIQQGSLTKTTGYSTDGFQFYGLSYKETNKPEALFKSSLANEIYQYEFAYTALQTEMITLNGSAHFTFYGLFKGNHPDTIEKVEFLEEVEKLRESISFSEKECKEINKIQLSSQLGEPIRTEPLTEEEIDFYFPNRHEEEYQEGKLLSFFTDTHEHVVLKEKELLVERPHGHILMSGNNIRRTDEVMTTTSYMFGVINSQTLVGNTTYNKWLSNTRNPLNVLKSSGQRIYIEIDGKYHLLTMPSMFEIGFNYTKWFYKLADDMLIITNYTLTDSTQLKLHVESVNKKAYRYMITNQVVMNDNEYVLPYHYEVKDNSVTFYADDQALNAKQYPELKYRMIFEGTDFSLHDEGILFENYSPDVFPLTVVELESKSEWTMTLQGMIDEKGIAETSTNAEQEAEKYRKFLERTMRGFKLTLPTQSEDLSKFNDLIWWYTHNMLVHYSVPHGLEQYGGAAWGTRDVCQGPAEYFLATQHYDSVREIIEIVYSHQYEDDGNWPQWFMFDKYYQIQQEESHGDIIVWPLKILSDYLLVTGDHDILNKKVPYTVKGEFSFTKESYPIYHHVMKEIEYINNHFIHDTYLSSYGDGDWDDTLQPANNQLRQYMVSSWTVALTYQAVRQMSIGLAKVDEEKSKELAELAEHIKADFQKYMLQDEIIPGFLYMEDPNKPELMLHPEDNKTGIHYRLIPMTQSIISELFNLDQAETHYQVIKENLYFPDGVRLMNKPANYTGGNSVHFQRAEQAANFGREVGLQYVHAHIRFIEAMAKLGNADEVWWGLKVINPIGIQKEVPNAEIRQSNAYFSSSDGKFNTRYEAQDNFDALRDGKVPVKGGWRIYSSGPGIYINQLISNVLGIRIFADTLVVDPVLPKKLDGLEFEFELGEIPVTFVYHIQGNHVDNITINGEKVTHKSITNPYRSSGISLELNDVTEKLAKDKENKIEIFMV